MATSTVSPGQGWSSTDDHAPVSQWDTTSNHAAAVTPDDAGLVSRIVSALGATSSKIAHNLDPTPTLARIGEADDLAGQGRWADAWNTLRDLLPGASPSQQVLGNQQGNTFAEQKAFVQDTVQKFKAGDYSGAVANVATVALANPEIVRRGMTGLSDVAGKVADTTASAVNPYVAGVKPVAAGVKAAAPAIIKNLPVVGKPITAAADAFQTARQALQEAQARQQAAAAVAAQRANPRQSLADQAGIQSGGPPVIPPVEPIAPDIAALRAKLAARLQQNKAAAAAPTVEAVPAQEDLALLDGIARNQTGKAFAKLPAAAQDVIRLMAQRGTQTPATAATPVVPPAATPAAAVPPPVPTPSVSAPLQTASTPAPAPESTALPPAASVPAQQQTSVRSVPIVAPTSLFELLKNPEYYPPSTAEHIPTPAQLGFGVYGETLPESSSVLGHIKAENEKAFNAADYAFRSGITDPSAFDKMDAQQSKAFVDEALEHGRKVGNPTPKTKYKRGLDGHTLDLAKAHLAKMVDDAGQAQIAGGQQ